MISARQDHGSAILPNGSVIVVGGLSSTFAGLASSELYAPPSSGCSGDTDCDGLPDSYEQVHPCLNSSVNDAGADPDADGLTSLTEYSLGTDPCNADTDRDGYSDGRENALGTNPISYCAVMRADVNGDGTANILDLSVAAGAFTKTVPPAPQRYDQGPPSSFDNVINILDLTRIAGVYQDVVAQCS